MRTVTQNDRILNYLNTPTRKGTRKSLSATQARTMFGVRNLRARVSELRDLGVRIETVTSRSATGNAYRLV